MDACRRYVEMCTVPPTAMKTEMQGKIKKSFHSGILFIYSHTQAVSLRHVARPHCLRRLLHFSDVFIMLHVSMETCQHLCAHKTLPCRAPNQTDCNLQQLPMSQYEQNQNTNQGFKESN